jgi:hypothetical protein
MSLQLELPALEKPPLRYKRDAHLRWMEKLKADPLRLAAYRARCKAYKQAHPEKAWHRMHPEEAKARARVKRIEKADQVAAYRSKWRAANKEKERETSRRWERENPEARKRHREKAKRKPGIRLASALRSRMNFKVVDGSGRLVSLYKSTMLGCSPRQLAKKFEALFADGMTWENYGKHWVVDHIRPVASFNLTKPEEMAACCHWSNLRPLLAAQNRQKGAQWKQAA